MLPHEGEREGLWLCINISKKNFLDSLEPLNSFFCIVCKYLKSQ